jgi:hypothetical protein
VLLSVRVQVKRQSQTRRSKSAHADLAGDVADARWKQSNSRVLTCAHSA